MINLSCNGGETLPVTMNISKLCTVRARCAHSACNSLPVSFSNHQHYDLTGNAPFRSKLLYFMLSTVTNICCCQGM